MHRLYQEQQFSRSKEELWEFISNPVNLNEITPPELDFEILTNLPGTIYNGLLIQYNVKLPYLGKSDWITEIKHIIPGTQFVDEQRIGPYSFWYHIHQLEENEDGVKMVDEVFYQPPYGMFGDLAARYLISKKLDQIFSYRFKILRTLFG